MGLSRRARVAPLAGGEGEAPHATARAAVARAPRPPPPGSGVRWVDLWAKHIMPQVLRALILRPSSASTAVVTLVGAALGSRIEGAAREIAAVADEVQSTLHDKVAAVVHGAQNALEEWRHAPQQLAGETDHEARSSSFSVRLSESDVIRPGPGLGPS